MDSIYLISVLAILMNIYLRYLSLTQKIVGVFLKLLGWCFGCRDEKIITIKIKLGCYILKLLGKGYEICYLIKIKLVAGKDEIWFMIFKALSEKSWKYYWVGGYILKLKILNMLGKMIKFGTWIIKIGYKIEKCSTNVFYVLFFYYWFTALSFIITVLFFLLVCLEHSHEGLHDF